MLGGADVCGDASGGAALGLATAGVVCALAAVPESTVAATIATFTPTLRIIFIACLASATRSWECLKENFRGQGREPLR